MKKGRFLLAFLLAFPLLQGCSNSDEPIENPSPMKTIRASIFSSANTRTELGSLENGNYIPVWSDNDKIGVFFNGDGYASTFTLKSGAGTSTAEFQGPDKGSNYQAFYPLELINGAIKDESISFKMPATQSYVEGSFSNQAYPMLSTLSEDNNDITFENLFSIATVSLKGEETIQKITLSSGSVSLSGNATVNLSSKEVSFDDSSDNSISLSVPSVTLDESESTDFYIVIPAQNYTDGLTLTVITTEGTWEKEITGNLNFNTSELRHINATIDSNDLIKEEVLIADTNFKEFLLSNFDFNNDGIFTQNEADLITELEVHTDNISSLEGIEFFHNLEILTASAYDNSEGNGLTSIDVSQNTKLIELDCSNNQLTSLDLSENLALTRINCGVNQLSELNLSENTNLQHLLCYDNQIESLILPNSTSLIGIDCGRNLLEELDMSSYEHLEVIKVDCNKLSELQLPNSQMLYHIQFENNNITDVDFSQYENLTLIEAGDNQLSELDVTHNLKLESLYCYGNPLTSLDISRNKQLEYVEASCGQMEYLFMSMNSSLQPDINENTEIVYVSDGQMQPITIGDDIDL